MSGKTRGETAKGIFLTLPEPMIKKLEKEKENFSYESIQEIIKEILRNKFFRESPTGAKKGRPKEFNLLRVGSAKKVFK